MSITIERPLVTIVTSPSGKSFSYNVTADHWELEWQRDTKFSSKKACTNAMAKFETRFDKLASEIENKERGAFGIMKWYGSHGLFKSRKKMDQQDMKGI